MSVKCLEPNFQMSCSIYNGLDVCGPGIYIWDLTLNMSGGGALGRGELMRGPFQNPRRQVSELALFLPYKDTARRSPPSTSKRPSQRTRHAGTRSQTSGPQNCETQVCCLRAGVQWFLTELSSATANVNTPPALCLRCSSWPLSDGCLNRMLLEVGVPILPSKPTCRWAHSRSEAVNSLQ